MMTRYDNIRRGMADGAACSCPRRAFKISCILNQGTHRIELFSLEPNTCTPSGYIILEANQSPISSWLEKNAQIVPCRPSAEYLNKHDAKRTTIDVCARNPLNTATNTPPQQISCLTSNPSDLLLENLAQNPHYQDTYVFLRVDGKTGSGRRKSVGRLVDWSTQNGRMRQFWRGYPNPCVHLLSTQGGAAQDYYCPSTTTLLPQVRVLCT